MKQVPYRLAEALENVCKHKSLENITVSQIAAEAGVTRQVFYHHFDDKFELASWIHYVHLYQSVKQALEEDAKQLWRRTTKHWLNLLEQNKFFYKNAFQSVSQKEFQRIIRDFFFACYQWQIEQYLERPMKEEELFVLHCYLLGGMEKVYEWIETGMTLPVDYLVELLELAMPEKIRALVLGEHEVSYKQGIKEMEKFLLAEGLLQTIA